MPMAEQDTDSKRRIFRFGLFEVDATGSKLTRAGVSIKIHDQPFCVLVALLERPGEIVTREDLRLRLWPKGTYVDFDECLNVILKKLRATLGDTPNNPRFIETVPRKGYRFITPVSTVYPRAASEPIPASQQRQPIPIGGLQPSETPVRGRRLSIGSTRAAWAAAVFLGVISIAALLIHYWPFRGRGRTDISDTMPATSVAVVPFANLGAGPSFDYLRYALASDIVTDLTYARFISVRPFTSTAKYGEHPEDPEAVGHDMKVAYVISGYFATEKGRLAITAEMDRVADDRVVWRDTLSADPNELIHLHDDFVWSLQKGVFDTLGSGETVGKIPSPHNQHAYDLYLRSVAIPRDPQPNKEAITDLEQSVKEDPNYPPAWVDLAWRYYIDASYSNGGKAEYEKSEEASAHAASIDPRGTANWITIRTENGDLRGAYDLAQKLLRWRPDSWAPHFELSYIYRYAGLLDEAAKECQTALASDPGNPILRSCSKVFLYQGDYTRAHTYVNLDGSSGWSVRERMQFALRQKNYAEALALAKVAVETGYTDSEIIVERLENQPSSILDATAAKEEAFAYKQTDSEEAYEIGAMLSFAGEPDRAMRTLRWAVRSGYCAVPELESDPVLESVRDRSDFTRLKDEAAVCQRGFLTHVKALNAQANPGPH
jgi:DNA-binding winged helix-turn-helix (wHTH) protein/TolB-like protein/tetratricopeptide (TPR) repeat protein